MKKIDVSGWKEFKISELFITEKNGSSIQVPTGAMISKRDLEDGNIPRVTVSNFNNGITGYYKDVENKNYRTYENFISVSFLGTVFYQPEKTSLDMKVHCLMLKNKTLNTYIAQFLVAVIKKVMSNFAYADQLSSTVLPELYIKLPALTKYIPDFDTLTREISGGGINMNKIDTSSWKEFEISELFDIHPTKNLGLTNHELFSTTGNTPVVVNSSCNNGIGGYVDLSATEDGGIITFSDTTDANSIFYQKENFIGYSHVQGMYPKFDNNSDEIMQYIMTVFKAKALTKGYNYSNKFRRDDALKIKILLPAKTINEPDWQFMEEYIKEIQKKVQNKTFKQKGHRKKIDITTAGNKTEEEWKRFKVGDFFDAERGSVKGLQKQEPGKVPVIAAAGFNQGIAGFYDVSAVYKDKITVSCNGAGCGSAFYHDYDFNITGDAIVLIDKQEFSHAVKEFIACMLNGILTRKYSYEEKCSADKVKEEEIFLPANENGQPDWEGIEKFMCSIADNSRDTLSRITLSELQDIYKKVTFASGGGRWKRFRIGDYFSVEYGKFRPKKELGNGNINYITTSGFNNGVTDTYTTAEHQGNCITVASDGALMGTAFYQKEPFSTSNIVSTLTPFSSTPLNEYNALFLCAIIYQKRGEFGWLGYKFSVDRVRNLMVLLPVDNAGNPDWDYMENYIKELTTKTSKNIDLLSKVS